jgi:hypothetical protein
VTGLVEVIKTKNGTVEWRGREVMLILEKATADALEAAAFSVEGKAKQNIVANDQVDTGFMLNSVYAIGQGSKGLDNYQKASSQAGGKNPDGKMLNKEQPPDDGLTALVAVGAEYAIYQEIQNSFLYRALEQEVADFGGKLIEKVQAAT